MAPQNEPQKYLFSKIRKQHIGIRLFGIIEVMM